MPGQRCGHKGLLLIQSINQFLCRNWINCLSSTSHARTWKHGYAHRNVNAAESVSPFHVGEPVGLLICTLQCMEGEGLRVRGAGFCWVALNSGHRSHLLFWVCLLTATGKPSHPHLSFQLNTWSIEYPSHCNIFVSLDLSYTKSNWSLPCWIPSASFIPAKIKFFFLGQWALDCIENLSEQVWKDLSLSLRGKFRHHYMCMGMQLQREVNHRRCSVGIWVFHSFNQLTNRYLLAVCRFQDMLDLKGTKIEKKKKRQWQWKTTRKTL